MIEKKKKMLILHALKAFCHYANAWHWVDAAKKTKTKDLNATKRKTEIKSVLLSTIDYDSIRKKG